MSYHLFVLLIQVNLEVLDIWCIAQVVITAPMLVVFAYPAFLEGIIIRVILLIFWHRPCHLIGCHLHWGDSITIAGVVWNQEVAWVCFDRTIVCLLDVIECIYRESRQYAQLGHVVALYIVAGFRVFHLSDEPRVVAAQYGICYYRLVVTLNAELEMLMLSILLVMLPPIPSVVSSHAAKVSAAITNTVKSLKIFIILVCMCLCCRNFILRQDKPCWWSLRMAPGYLLLDKPVQACSSPSHNQRESG